MCLIIARKTNAPAIPENYINIAAKYNQDGFGIVGRTPDKDVYIAKTLKMSESLEIIRTFEKENVDFIAHFRAATHGKVNDANTHPFKLQGENYLMHNGIVNVATPNKDFSDTWHFVNEMQSHIKDKAISPKWVTAFFDVNKKLASGSKFALLGENLPITIINEDQGETKDGVWYSNGNNFDEPKYTYGWDVYDELAEIDAAYDDIATNLEYGVATLGDLILLDKNSLETLCYEYPNEIAEAIRKGEK